MSEQKINKWIDPDKDIVEHLIIQKAVPIGEDGEVSVQEEYIESRRYDRQEYINSFRNDVGILNIIKKVGIEGAMTQCRWAGTDKIVDISTMPDNIDEAYNVVDNAHKLYASLPDTLKGKMTFEQFVKEFNQEAFAAYIKTQTKESEVEKDVK